MHTERRSQFNSSLIDHSYLQSCVAHISIYLLGVHHVLTSPSKKHGRHCFECFWSRFGNQEMLLAINFHGKSILQRTMKQFGPVATKENGSENRDKRKFACAGVSLHRRFYSFQLIGYVCFSGSAFQFGFLPSKPCFSLKCVTLNSCYTDRVVKMILSSRRIKVSKQHWGPEAPSEARGLGAA